MSAKALARAVDKRTTCICGKFWDDFGFHIKGQVKVSSGQQTGQQHAEQKEKTPGKGYFTF
jgi:hypothetical protein